MFDAYTGRTGTTRLACVQATLLVNSCRHRQSPRSSSQDRIGGPGGRGVQGLIPGRYGNSPVNTDYPLCDPQPSIVLTSIVSDEPDDALGNGDGNTTDDIEQAAIGTPDFNFRLRAERAGSGDGRVYTVTYTATDACGLSTAAAATVLVPHH